MGAWDWLIGSEDKIKQVPNKSKEQNAFNSQIMNFLQQQMQGGGGFNQANNYWQSLLEPGGFEQFSQPYMQQFNEQVLPQIGERFAGMGALSSSGFGQALGGAASGLQSQLAQLFSSLQGNAANSLMGSFQNMSQQGLNYDPFQYVKQKGQMGLLPTFGYGAAQSAGQNFFGGGGGGGGMDFGKLMQMLSMGG